MLPIELYLKRSFLLLTLLTVDWMIVGMLPVWYWKESMYLSQVKSSKQFLIHFVKKAEILWKSEVFWHFLHWVALSTYYWVWLYMRWRSVKMHGNENDWTRQWNKWRCEVDATIVIRDHWQLNHNVDWRGLSWHLDKYLTQADAQSKKHSGWTHTFTETNSH